MNKHYDYIYAPRADGGWEFDKAYLFIYRRNVNYVCIWLIKLK